jgi:putative holliday junction resolvase
MASRLKFFMAHPVGLGFDHCSAGPENYNFPVSFIGIDYGGRRVGIAVSESGILASPHGVIANQGADQVVERIAALGARLGAETFVVGVPRRPHSTAGEEKFRRFADRLRQRTHKEVVLWDETLSTVEGAARARAAGRSARKTRQEIDMHAAAVILQSWLDARGGRQP